MQVLTFETLLTLRLEFPLQFSADSVDRIEPAAIASEIYDSVLYRGRRRHPDPGEELPFLCAGLEIDRV